MKETMTFEDFYLTEEVTDEMIEFFDKRTANHIGLVQKYCQKIDALKMDGLEDLIKKAEVHDASKLKEPEKTPYVYVTWDYKCKDDGTDFSPPSNIKDEMSKATKHHVKNNAHHPEFHSPKEVGLINREDRDKAPDEMVDATKMDKLSIAEMVADFCAMSKEKGNTPKEWVDKNVGVRWEFTDEQKKLIYELIDEVWDNEI